MSLVEDSTAKAVSTEETAPNPIAAKRHRLRRLGVTSWEQSLLCISKGYADFSKIMALE